MPLYTSQCHGSELTRREGRAQRLPILGNHMITAVATHLVSKDHIVNIRSHRAGEELPRLTQVVEPAEPWGRGNAFFGKLTR